MIVTLRSRAYVAVVNEPFMKHTEKFPASPHCHDWFLAIDAGNTRVKFGLFAVSETLLAVNQLPSCLGFWAIGVGESVPWETLAAHDTRDFAKTPTAAILTGSNPRECNRLKSEWPTNWPQPDLRLDPRQFPLELAVDFPERVGVDRVLKAVAANRLRASGDSVLIVDSGTALTVDAISSQGVFLGGAICPGLRLGARALHQYTALLPEVTRRELEERVPAACGKNTVDALRSGLFWGHVGTVREVVKRMAAELGTPSPLFLLTGGSGPLLAPHFPEARFEQALSLQGIAATFWRKNG